MAYALSRIDKQKGADGKAHSKKRWYAGERAFGGYTFKHWDSKSEARIFDRKADANRMAKQLGQDVKVESI